MKEIITWQASVKVKGVWHTTEPKSDLAEVTKLVEQMVKKLSLRYLPVTYVRNVTIVEDKTVEAK
jgi:cysteinyl-tRNA synthetase